MRRGARRVRGGCWSASARGPRSANRYRLQEKTRASLRLVDEYMSLTVEQFFRKAVADMDALPRSGVYIELRKELMEEVLREERYRKEHQLRSRDQPHR